jgi:hypothetical protein
MLLRNDKLARPISLRGRADYLIDQLVYLLYGLTEEEVAIVEGRGLLSVEK